MFGRLLLLVALLSLPFAGGEAKATCRQVASTDLPPPSPLRPVYEGVCDFSAAEAKQRILSVFELESGALTIEAVERAFDLPRLTTSFDSTRSADYSAILTGTDAPSGEPWRMVVHFAESFYPKIAERRDRFRGTLRPERVNPGERGRISLRIRWAATLYGLGRDSPLCLPFEAIDAARRRNGWSEPRLVHLYSHHGPQRYNLETRRGALRFSTATSPTPPCISDLNFLEPPNPPVPPLTDADIAAAHARSAELLRRAMQARQPLPSVD